ncbi:suppressor of fused domain protein [Nocardia sp. NPDC052112]|uniref:suppressor of fused domain protein n=1 Tax=Nocardia sp. NPDC052112 TaxID=3155646 RepID=UPI003420F8E3
MTSASQFPNLLEHNSEHLGKFRYAEPAEIEGRNRGYDLIFYDNDEHPVTSVITNGLRFHEMPSLLPEELVCTLNTGQEGFSHYIVGIIADLILRNQRGIEYDSILVNDTPLITETKIHGVLGYPSPFFGDEFDLLRNSDGKPVLQLITLLPITRQEAEFADENSPDELWEIWAENRTDLLDINRGSAV